MTNSIEIKFKRIHLQIPFRPDYNGRPCVAVDQENSSNMMIKIHPYYAENSHRYGRAYHFYAIQNYELDKTFKYTSMDSFYPDLMFSKNDYHGLRKLLDNSNPGVDVIYDFICDNQPGRAIFKPISQQVYLKIDNQMDVIPKMCYGAVESNERFWALLAPTDTFEPDSRSGTNPFDPDENFLEFEEYVKIYDVIPESNSTDHIDNQSEKYSHLLKYFNKPYSHGELTNIKTLVEDNNFELKSDVFSVDLIHDEFFGLLEEIEYGSFDKNNCHYFSTYIYALTDTYINEFYGDIYHSNLSRYVYGFVFGRPDSGVEIFIAENPLENTTYDMDKSTPGKPKSGYISDRQLSC
jgi:hypothetical protein